MYEATTAFFVQNLDALSNAWQETAAGLAFLDKCIFARFRHPQNPSDFRRDKKSYPALTKEHLAYWDSGNGEKLSGLDGGISLKALSEFWKPILSIMQTRELEPVQSVNALIAEHFRVCIGLKATKVK